MDIKSKRITLVQKEDYRVDLEYNEQFAILHLPAVDKFNKTVYIDLQICMEDIKEFLAAMDYPYVHVGLDPSNKTIRKFTERLGFGYLGTHDNIDVLGLEL